MQQQYTNMDGEDNRAIYFKGVKYGRKGKKKTHRKGLSQDYAPCDGHNAFSNSLDALPKLNAHVRCCEVLERCCFRLIFLEPFLKRFRV